MVIKLFFLPESPPSRNALMALNALGLEHEIVPVNVFSGAQKQPEYLAINPRGKVPALQDGDYLVAESRAIACYLCNKYEKATKDKLYPTEPQARGTVDQLLYASENISDLIVGYLDIGGVAFGSSVTCEAKIGDVHKALGLVNTFLGSKKFVAADYVTIADFFCASPIITAEELVGFKDYSNCQAVKDWLERIKSLPYFDRTHKEGLSSIAKKYKDKLAINKAAAGK
uniref:Glutathione transferase n=1 Tax=Ciona savignyi TaxID=51511 RepID=H2Z1J3_CIOSA